MNKITVAKFGGTSMASAEAMKKSAQIIINNPQIRLVVVSATSGTTNHLLRIYEAILRGQALEVSSFLEELTAKHLSIARAIQCNTDEEKCLTSLFREATELSSKLSEISLLDPFLSIGERLASILLVATLRNLGQSAIDFDARSILRTDGHFGKAEPLLEETARLIKQNLSPLLNSERRVVTQGFIGSTQSGESTTLGRGGSDYSAALFAEGLLAEKLEIWTDVSGIFTMDPNIVPNAKPIPAISFDEAAELANFGAKVLHPATLWPAIRKDIQVFVGSTFAPEKGGTWIYPSLKEGPVIRAIALRKNQTLITVSSLTMLNAQGFLARLFTLLANYHLSVDLVTTSEVSVSLTIDGTNSGSSGASILENKKLFEELRTFCDVEVEEDLTLVAIIGNRLTQTPGLGARAFTAISDSNVRLICHGASNHNFCFLVSQGVAQDVARRLHEEFIGC